MLAMNVIGDILTCTRMAYSIYNCLIRPALEAATEYRDLVNAIGSLYDVLSQSQDDIGCNFENAEPQKQETIKKMIKDTYCVLAELKKVQQNIQKSEQTQRLHLLGKVKWAIDRPRCVELRVQIIEKITVLKLCVMDIEFSKVQTQCKHLEELVQTVIRNQEKGRKSRSTARSTAAESSLEPESSDTKSRRKQAEKSPVESNCPTNDDDLIIHASRHAVEQLLRERDAVIQKVVDDMAQIRWRSHLSHMMETSNVKVYNNPEHTKHFQESVSQVTTRYKELGWEFPNTAESWLRTASWWFLKSRQREAQNSTDDARLPQVNMDLWKACWLVYEKVPKASNDPQGDDLNLLYHLLNGLEHDILRIEGFPDTERRKYIFSFTRENYSLYEQFGDGSELLIDPMDVHLSLRANRWLAWLNDGAIGNHEQALFRAFVHVSFRENDLQNDFNHPCYMLVVSLIDGEGQPQISLGNQIGSLNLTKDFEEKDFSVGSGGGENSPYVLYFSRLLVRVRFLHCSDRKRFFDITRQHFSHVWRSQKLGTFEKQLFQGTIQIKEHRYPNSSNLSPQFPCTCEMRIYETVGAEGWNTTRRVILTGSAVLQDNKGLSLWSLSYFLPLSRVYLKHEELMSMTIKWSDCNHATRIRPSFDNKCDNAIVHPDTPFAWDPDRPNIYLRLAFQTPEESTKFRSVILGLSSPLKASRLRSIPNSIRQHRNVSVVSAATTFRTLATVSSSGEEILERRIYVLRGRNAIGSSRGLYHGLFLVKQCHCWEYADLYLMPRQLDFQSKQGKEGLPSVVFSRLSDINYISKYHGGEEHTDYPNCEIIRREKDVVVDFQSIFEAKRFLEYLCESHQNMWELQKWYICDLSYRRRGFIAGVFKQEVKGAEVSEWRIAGAPNASPVTVDGVWALNETHRVLIRLPYKREKDIWISCDSTDVALKSTPDHISCGQFLDIVSMTAVHPEGDQTAELSVGKLKTLIYSSRADTTHIYEEVLPIMAVSKEM